MSKNGFRIFWRRSTTRSACTRLWGIVLPMSMSEPGRGGTLLSTQNEIVVYRAFTKAVFERNSNRKRKIPKTGALTYAPVTVQTTGVTPILQMRQYFLNDGAASVDQFFPYLLNKVLLVFVSTEDLEDAFRLFTVLNARGVPLRNSDILKAWNLGEIKSTDEKIKY